MNQTKKRLSIINLAISITDLETIQLQILKLRLLKTDEKIQEILSTLKSENYAQAQALITQYIDTPNKEILQRTFQEEKSKRREKTQKEKEIISEFNLFDVEDGTEEKETEVHILDLDEMMKMGGLEVSQNEKETAIPTEEDRDEDTEIQTLDLDDMLKLEEEGLKEQPRAVHETANFDALLNMDPKEILSDNIDIDISHKETNDFWDEEVTVPNLTEDIPKDTFFDTEESEEALDDNFIKMDNKVEDALFAPLTAEEKLETKESAEEDFMVEEMFLEEIPEIKAPDDLEDISDEFMEPEVQNISLNPMHTPDLKEIQEKETLVSTDSEAYKAIPYIDQKFKNMQVQYPMTEESDERFTSVDHWLLQISNEGYSEKEVEAILEKIDKIRAENMPEAAQLLLICAATESKYAQFILARTLYKGDILQKNLPEAFTIINRLAVNDDYPEAICDLAQFYEHGIGIAKDKEKAQMLYEEAMNAGIKRAAAHFERLRKHNKGFFSFLAK